MFLSRDGRPRRRPCRPQPGAQVPIRHRVFVQSMGACSMRKPIFVQSMGARAAIDQ